MYDTIAQTALFNALSPLLTSYQQDGSARLYFVNAPSGAIAPYATFQWQSDFLPDYRVGHVGVTVLTLIKAWAPTLGAAQTVRNAMVTVDSIGEPTIPTLAYTGYDVDAVYAGSPTLPYDGYMYQVGDLFRVSIWKNIP